jgi:hypothetical protein
VARPSSSMRGLHPIEEAARRFCSGASGDTEHPGARINAFPPVMVFRAGRQFPLSGCRLNSPGSRRSEARCTYASARSSTTGASASSSTFGISVAIFLAIACRVPAATRAASVCASARPVIGMIHRGTILRPAYRAPRGRAGPGTRWGRDKWPAPTCARGRPSPGRRPLPDPVPVKAELRLLARETLDPGEVGPSEPSTRTAWLPPRGVLTGG